MIWRFEITKSRITQSPDQKKLFHNMNSRRATTSETLILVCHLPHGVLLNQGPTFEAISPA